jgi:hypothetical protein
VPGWRFKHTPELDEANTGFSFIDVLFGFVIAELFSQLPGWRELSPVKVLHLIAGLILVLGSYVGYRKSRNQSHYKIFLFNLPLLRFLVDQGMLALYFGFAILGRHEAANSDITVVSIGLDLLTGVFVLYVAWDLIGWRMSNVGYVLGTPGKSKGSASQGYDWVRFMITALCCGAFLSLNWWFDESTISDACLLPTELMMVAVLIFYRWLKDVRR